MTQEGGWLEAQLAVRRRARRQFALLWGAVAVSLLLLAPFGHLLTTFLPACPFKTLTGWPCPACGATRAALALAHLDLIGALIRYPLATLAWIGLIAGGLLAAGWTLLGRDLPEPPRTWPLWSRALLVLIVATNWAYSIATGV